MARKRIVFVVIVLSLILAAHNHARQEDFPVLKGPYLGQKPPGMTPEMFAPGIVSTELHDDAAPAFSPDGDEAYFRIVYNMNGEYYGTIFMMRLEDGRWSSPKIAPFSGKYMDGGVSFSRDSRKLFFASTRREGNLPPADMDLWEVLRTGEGWGTPRRIPELNTAGNEMYPHESPDGMLYWNVEAKRNDLKPETFRSHRIDGAWMKREKVHLFDDPSIRIHTFASVGGFLLLTKMTEQNDVDMFVSFKRKDGTWGDPLNLGPAVNSRSMDKCPTLSPDGKYMFFVSSRPHVHKDPKKMWHSPLLENTEEIFRADV